jgi:hypothetical protein
MPKTLLPLSRRELIQGATGLALGALGSGCGISHAGYDPARDEWRTLHFDPDANVPEGEQALLLVPKAGGPRPILISLHGHPESGHGLDVGARAWPETYELARQRVRLFDPPLVPEDFGGPKMTSPARLSSMNDSLRKWPYAGLTHACPYVPWQASPTLETSRGFASFLVDRLLPRVRAETRCADCASLPGLCGVSMGGRLALFVGLSHPQIFGAVSALQPALREEDGELLTDLARAATAVPGFKLRLVTSKDDYFMPPIRSLSDRLARFGVAHEFALLNGDHSVEFNRGQGVFEMLLWHERVARGLAPP